MIIDQLGVGDREVVSFVGAGGKSTLMLRSGVELGSRSATVVMTTTTKMHVDQIPEDAAVVTPEDLGVVPVGARTFLVGSIDGQKVVGVEPPVVDRLFMNGQVTHVLVEADGARGRTLKAPADHEPVVPETTSLLVVIAGASSVGHTIDEVAHRPERVAALLGVSPHHTIRPADVAAVMADPSGGLKSLPDGSRAVAVLTGVRPGDGAAEEVCTALRLTERFDHVVTVGRVGGERSQQ